MKVIDAIAEILRRDGVGIAVGIARVKNGHPRGVFAMQSGPAPKTPYPALPTAFSDSSPVLPLPLGYPRDRAADRHPGAA